MRSNAVPNQCIWCLSTPPQAIFDVSHVMPRCTGNNDYTLLPPGIVCKKCNNYFGTKIEPILLDDPLFKIIAVVIKLTNPRTNKVFRSRIFDDGRAFDDAKPNHLSMKVDLSLPNKISVDVNWKESGIITRSYSPKDFAFLSRAVHKIAFEMYAWTHYVKGKNLPFPMFDARFNHVRQWVRYGQPQQSVRPVIRRMGLKPVPEVEMIQWKFPSDVGVEMRLFGDWYIVSIGSDPSTVKRTIAQLAPDTKRTWVISEEISTASTFIQMHKNA